jgi:SAM-dependent methyltransferase
MPPPPRRPFHHPAKPGPQAAGKPPQGKPPQGKPPQGKPPQGKPPQGKPPQGKPPQGERGWDPVAAWYDKLVGESGSDYHREVIVPATIRLLDPRPGESVIDVCCGQGVLFKPLLDAKVGKVTGIDASPRLIAAAKARHGAERRVTLFTADACAPGAWADGSHDAATCVMAVHDVADAVALFTNISRALKPGGRAVVVMMHPCFRIPRQSHWGWDADQKIQYRRLDAYGTPRDIAITTHPGKASGEQTTFHHRPLAGLLTAIGSGGLAVTACEELYSHRRSQVGPFSKAEHRAAQEFPLFLALTARRL